MRSLATVLCILVVGVAAVAAEPVTLTFVAGSGYIVAQGDFRLAIDALALPEISEATHTLMTEARAPFDVDLILVTHSDHDHFDPTTVSLHMAANPAVVLVAPADAIEAVRTLAPGIAPARLIAVHPEAAAPRTIEVVGLAIEVFSFPHPGGAPENVGYRFHLGGLVFVHPGDLNLNSIADDLARTGLGRSTADVLIIPYWAFTPDYAGAAEGWSARLVVPTHASLYDLRLACTLARGVASGVLCFTSLLQTKTIELAPLP